MVKPLLEKSPENIAAVGVVAFCTFEVVRR